MTARKNTLLSLMGLLLAGSAILAIQAGQAAEPAGLAIVGATVFDATGASPRVETVLIKDGRIAEVGPDIRIPANYRRIDARGEALLPGFFDLHTHWTPSGPPGVTPAIANADIAAGVTTSNDFNSAPEAFEARRKWLSTLIAPHVNMCARFSVPGGHGADWADAATTKLVNTPEAARAEMDAVLPYKPDCLGEVMTDGWRYGTSPNFNSMNEDTITALVSEAHKYHTPVLTHTLRTQLGAEAGRAKVDVIAHALQDLPITDAQVAAIKNGGSFYAPTFAVYDPDKPGRRSMFSGPDDPRRVQAASDWHNAQANTKKLYDAGVPIASGTDAGMPGTPHGTATLHEMELMVQAGLPPSAALIAATANSAKAMGEFADRGSIEKGKRADLVLIKGAPWQNIGDVEKTDRVFVDGRLVHGPGAPPPNPVVPMPSVAVGPLVDDFERPDGRSNLDTLVVTEPDGGLDRSVEVIDIISREDGGHALSMTGKLSIKPDPEISVVLPLTKGSVQPADLRKYKGVKLDLRGDGPYEVVLNTLAGSYTAAVTGGPKWQTVEVPFTDLKKEKGRVEFPTSGWTGDDVVEIEIMAKRKGGEKAWLMLDNVGFY